MTDGHKTNGNRRSPHFDLSPAHPRGTIASRLGTNLPPNQLPSGFWYPPTSGAMMPYGMIPQPTPHSYELALRPPPPPPSQQMPTMNSMDTIQLILAAQAQQNQQHREEMAREREANREFQRKEREANQAFQASLLQVFFHSMLGRSFQGASALEPVTEPAPSQQPDSEAVPPPPPPPEQTTPIQSITEIAEEPSSGKRRASEGEEEGLPAKRSRKTTPRAAAAQANSKYRLKK